jgi:hypothetical protein
MAKKKTQKQETKDQELKRLRALVAAQSSLIEEYREFAGSLPSSMSDFIEGYWERLNKIDWLSEPFNDPDEYEEENDDDDDDEDEG